MLRRIRFTGILLISIMMISIPIADIISQEKWTKKEAIDEINALIVPDRNAPNLGIVESRAEKVTAWLTKVEQTKLDLGEDAYIIAFAMYLDGKREAARKSLGDHIVKYGELPDNAGKYTGWISRILPSAIGQALTEKEYDRVRATLPTLAKYGGSAYSAYATFATQLVDSNEPDDVMLLVDIVTMSLNDSSMDGETKNNLLKFIYGNSEGPATKNLASSSPTEQKRVAPSRATSPTTARPSGIRFVTFNGYDLDGNEISVEDFKGKILLVDFWAAWCAPCIREMPNVAATYKRHKDEGFEVLGVVLEGKGRTDYIRATMKKLGMDWPQIYDGLGWQTRPAVLNNVRSIPSSVLLDRSGTPRYANLRGRTLERRVVELLEEPKRGTSTQTQ